MRIEIVDKDGNEIQNIELDCNPFRIGEIIHIHRTNYAKDKWNVENLDGDFMIDKIEHYYREEYRNMGLQPSTMFATSVEVRPVCG